MREALQREAAEEQTRKRTKLGIPEAVEDSAVCECDGINNETQGERNSQLLLRKDWKPEYIIEIRRKNGKKEWKRK